MTEFDEIRGVGPITNVQSPVIITNQTELGFRQFYIDVKFRFTGFAKINPKSQIKL